MNWLSRGPKEHRRRRVGGWLYLSIAILLALASEVRAMEPKLGFGLAWAPLSGHGLSLRIMPKRYVGFQAGWAFWKTDDWGYFNFGMSALVILSRLHRHSLYFPVGVCLKNKSEATWQGDLVTVEEEFSYGTGVGYTFRTGDFNNLWYSIELVGAIKKKSLQITPQLGIHYFV